MGKYQHGIVFLALPTTEKTQILSLEPQYWEWLCKKNDIVKIKVLPSVTGFSTLSIVFLRLV